VLPVADARFVWLESVPLPSLDWYSDVSDVPVEPGVAVDSVLSPVVPAIIECDSYGCFLLAFIAQASRSSENAL
jgi:hypothetical protein